MSVTRYRAAKDRTKKEQQAFFDMSATKYINGARAVARGYMKQNKILRTALWIMAAACIVMGGLLYWRWHGF